MKLYMVKNKHNNKEELMIFIDGENLKVFTSDSATVDISEILFDDNFSVDEALNRMISLHGWKEE